MKVLVVGSSSGIGLTTALTLINSGIEVFGAARGVSGHDFPQYSMDVRQPEIIASTLERVGTIDALVYSAGIGLASPIAETERQDYVDLFDVNFFGLCECVRQALPKIRNGGKIIAISSLAGAVNIPFNAYYCASKAAVNSFLTGLRMELKPRNIAVTSILPGGTQTAFTFKRKKYRSMEYAHDFECSLKHLCEDEQQGISPQAVAKSVLNTLLNDNPPMILPVSAGNKAAYLIDKLLPKRISEKIYENKYLQ